MLNNKILMLRKDLRKEPLKVKACIGSNLRVKKMFSLSQMCKIWEKQSFVNIRRVSLSSPKYKKCIFNKMFKISIG